MKAVLSSLTDFVGAGLRPRTPLARAIVLALAIKLVVIVSMKVLLFSGDARPAVDATVMMSVIGPAGAAQSGPATPAPSTMTSESYKATFGPGG